MTRSIIIEVGEQPEAFRRRYGQQVEANEKNISLNFYTIDWNAKDPGTVVLKQGSSSILIEDVLGVSGTFNTSFPKEGLSSYDVSFGLSIAETMSHDEARLRFYELLRRLQKAGWQRWIYQASARLSSAEALRYKLANPYTADALDPGYLPSLEDWMKLIDGTSWEFYQDGVYMEIYLYRDRDRMKVDEPGAYFIKLSIEAFDSKWRTLFPEKDRHQWRELLPRMREDEAAQRQAEEEKLQAAGYKIDTEYRNPDEGVINPPKTASHKTGEAPTPAPEIKVATGQLCPVAGVWECSDQGNTQQLHVRASRPMPKAIWPAPRSTWQKLRGEQPTYTTDVVWTLVQPDAMPPSVG